MHQKLAPDPFSILLNKPKQPLHARNYFKNKVIWKSIMKEPSKKLTLLFFLTQSLLIDKVIKNKRGLELVTSCSSSRKTSSEKFLYSLYIIWPNLMIKCKAVFELFQKITSANLCKSIHDIINYSTSICLFESGKCEKKGKKGKIIFAIICWNFVQ